MSKLACVNRRKRTANLITDSKQANRWSEMLPKIGLKTGEGRRCPGLNPRRWKTCVCTGMTGVYEQNLLDANLIWRD